MRVARGASADVLRLRAAMLARVRAFLAARGVLEVETPTLSRAAPTDPALEPIAAHARALGGEAWLHTSPEFAMKRLVADGFGDCYQLGRVYRDDELGRWHQPEFTLLEWYRLGFDEYRLMDEVAGLVRAAAGEVAADWPVRRLTYREAFIEGLGVDPLANPPHAAATATAAALTARGIEVPAGLDHDALLDLAFATTIQPSLAPQAWTFVHDYPASQAALARIEPGPPPVARRFELFAGGLELANGYRELNDPAEQRRRFAADQALRANRGLRLRPLDEAFLDAVGHLPECAGVALGIDRLVAVAVGATALRDVMAFAHE